jgi:hypothetical protein
MLPVANALILNGIEAPCAGPSDDFAQAMFSESAA